MNTLENLINRITLGDCLPILKTLPDKCIDLLLTDPPYGGGATNKAADAFSKVGGGADSANASTATATHIMPPTNIIVPHGRDLGDKIHKERRRRH